MNQRINTLIVQTILQWITFEICCNIICANDERGDNKTLTADEVIITGQKNSIHINGNYLILI